MTSALFCDGCGTVTTDTGGGPPWWSLSNHASPGSGMGMLSMLPTISLGFDLDEEPDEPEEPEELVPDEELHFCSIPCIGKWAEFRQTSEGTSPEQG